MSAPAPAPAPSRVARRNALAVTAAGVLWGTAGVAGLALGERTGLQPLSVGWYRLAIAALVLLGVRALRGGWRPAVARADLPRVAGVGVLLAWYQVAFFAAVDHAQGWRWPRWSHPRTGARLVAVATAAAGERPRAAGARRAGGGDRRAGAAAGRRAVRRRPGRPGAGGAARPGLGRRLRGSDPAVARTGGRVAPADLTVAGFVVGAVAAPARRGVGAGAGGAGRGAVGGDARPAALPGRRAVGAGVLAVLRGPAHDGCHRGGR